MKAAVNAAVAVKEFLKADAKKALAESPVLIFLVLLPWIAVVLLWNLVKNIPALVKGLGFLLIVGVFAFCVYAFASALGPFWLLLLGALFWIGCSVADMRDDMRRAARRGQDWDD
jgi:hypothetical protein